MSNEEISLDGYIRAVWRAKWLIIAAVIVAAALAVVVSRNRSPEQTASVVIKIGLVWKQQIEDPFVTVETVTAADFLEKVSATTGIKPPQLTRSLRAEPVIIGPRRSREPFAIRITAASRQSDEALRVAQAAADELVTRHKKLFADTIAPHRERERQLEEHLRNPALLSGSRELAIKLEGELTEIRFNNTSPLVTTETRVIEGPDAVSAPQPSAWRVAATASLIAGALAVAVAALTAHFKPSPSNDRGRIGKEDASNC